MPVLNPVSKSVSTVSWHKRPNVLADKAIRLY